ncbi:MAG: BTAD domain-containing putative transcriptional regulator, partial [Ilumatobacteraceae bacterium]
MRFQVLGPLEVSSGNGPIPLGGPKQRAVLAHLVIRANQVVPAAILIDEIWGDEPPASARNTLQTYVSHLRKALGEGRIDGRSPGYLLAVRRDELDADRFDDLVRAARKAAAVDPVTAARLFDDALELWRGPAFADLADEPSLAGEAARLNEIRLVAIEERLDALLAAGDHTQVVSEAESLVGRHPLRERLWGQLMVALYRAGRQADALSAFGRARGILAEELGIDPSPDLIRLQERILQQDPTLELRGEPLRGYRLLEQIGEGPQGTVFRAIQPKVERDVAVKIIHGRIASDPAFVRGFEARAQAVAGFDHPHVVPVNDYWREPDAAYIVSRYLRGGSLAARQASGVAMDPAVAAHTVDQVASALAAAHRQGLAHGNLVASNVLFDAEGNAYLSDLSIGSTTVPDISDDVVALARLTR